MAVVVFSKPVRGIHPAQLVDEGLLDEMKAAGTPNQSTAFTSVGYGAQETRPPHARARSRTSIPIFLGDTNIVVAVTVPGDIFCKSTYVTQRLDVLEVHEFVAQYV